jgi:nitric oxide reductase large subunit
MGGAALAGIVALWELLYIERGAAVQAIADKLKAEEVDDRDRRERVVAWFVWGSYAGLLLGFASVIARAIVEHNESLAHAGGTGDI